jgi:anti-sigma factor RsiW
MLHSSECPVDLEKVAEAYVRYTLPKEQAIAFEDHYATCETCATVLYKTVDYVDAMRAAKTPRSWPGDDLKMAGRSGN